MTSHLLYVALVLVAAPVEMPRVVDDRLQLELILQEPDIVTPTGLTIDARGRVLVIESNTHFRPDGYKGPPHDRILLIDPTKKPYQPTVFFEGSKYTMSVAKAPDDSIYVATRSEIFRLRDLDGDDKADKPEERTPLAHLETAGNYPHNGLAGFAFTEGDKKGEIREVYFGFGENLGADYKLIGSDGKSLAGGGEGGNIYACSYDGKNVRRVATGFWNPFHMTFNRLGQLFTVDNDPDSRPPCRLIHVVEGGDYGYRFRNGRKGTHPFTAWNGELPGTLPMVAGTGEAPCAVVSYGPNAFKDAQPANLLPTEYHNSLLVTSWGDHRIERYTLHPRGASFTAEMKPVVVGDHTFRPVGMATGPDGSIYFSDWVDRSYPLHGKGRVWRLRTKESNTSWVQSDKYQHFGPSADPELGSRMAATVRQWRKSELERDIEELAAYDAGDNLPQWLTTNIEHDAVTRRQFKVENPRRLLENMPAEIRSRYITFDPFLWQSVAAAVTKSLPSTPLGADEAARFLDRYTRIKNPNAVVWAAVGARDANPANASTLAPLLLNEKSTAAQVLGIIWVGENRLLQYRAAVEAALANPAATYQVVAVCFAALDAIDASDMPRDGGKSAVGERLAVSLVYNADASAAARCYALKLLRPDHPELATKKLKFLLDDPNPKVVVEVIRILRERPETATAILWLLDKSGLPQNARNEAIASLSPDDSSSKDKLVMLIKEDRLEGKGEALRVLRDTPFFRVSVSEFEREVNEQRIRDIDRAGDPAAGERLFFHPRVASCYRCHEYEGRGASVGPALTTFGRGASRERILQSILEPSKEIAPHYVPWILTTVDGRTLTGLYVGEEVDGTQRFVDAQGKLFKLHPREIEAREAAKQSIMPADFGRTLTDAELRDLAAFLAQPVK